jgi:hypothetical protein
MVAYGEIFLGLLFYRILVVLTGLAFSILGYKLFCRGVYEKAGELKAAWGDRHLILKQAAPGTFFALFGVVIIAGSLWRGFEVDIDRTRDAAPTAVKTPQRAAGVEQPGSISFAFPTRLDQKTVNILEKAAKGESLSAEERKALGGWIEREKVHFWAVRPDQPSSLEKTWVPG